MLLFDLHAIGNRLLTIRKRSGKTQAEVAEAAGLSDRTYADIERGTVNMRVETLLRICQALHITPDEILTEAPPQEALLPEDISEIITLCSAQEKQTAMKLLSVYLRSLET